MAQRLAFTTAITSNAHVELSLHQIQGNGTSSNETYYRIVSIANSSAVRVDISSPSARGLVYALQDLERHLENSPALTLRNLTQAPHFEYRALKFNLPWGAYAKGGV